MGESKRNWSTGRPRIAAHLMMFAAEESPAAARQALGEIALLGLDGVEMPLTQGLLEHAPWIAAVAEGLELKCIASTVLPPDGDIGSADADMRRRGLEFLERALDLAAMIGAEALGGVIHQPSRIVPSDPRSPDRRRRTVEALHAACDHAASVGVTLAVEPTNRFVSSEINTVDEALDLSAATGDTLGLVLDTYHLAAEEEDLVSAVARGAERAVMVQVNETNRGIIGRGGVDWEGVAAALESAPFRGWLSFEAFPMASAWHGRAFAWRDVGTAKQIVLAGLEVLGIR